MFICVLNVHLPAVATTACATIFAEMDATHSFHVSEDLCVLVVRIFCT